MKVHWMLNRKTKPIKQWAIQNSNLYESIFIFRKTQFSRRFSRFFGAAAVPQSNPKGVPDAVGFLDRAGVYRGA